MLIRHLASLVSNILFCKTSSRSKILGKSGTHIRNSRDVTVAVQARTKTERLMVERLVLRCF